MTVIFMIDNRQQVASRLVYIEQYVELQWLNDRPHDRP